MKISAIVVAFAATVFTAAAGAQVVGFTKYDYATQAGGGKASTNELAVGASVKTIYGTFDGAVTTDAVRTVARDSGAGIEVGYSNTINAPLGAVTGRAALGRKTQLGTANVQYYSLGAEWNVPVTSKISTFVGYRYRGDISSATKFSENRVSAGADFAIADKWNLRAGVTHTRAGKQQFNGVTTAVSYAF